MPGLAVKEGISIEAQLAEMKEYAAQREWRVVAEFVDAGVSGRTFERPGIQSLLAAVRAGSTDIVLVHELSRLSRTSVAETFAIFDILGEAGVGFASVKEPMFDLSTPTGRLMLSLISAMNQYYVDMLIMHTKKAKRQRARQGLYNASIVPYGYKPTEDPREPPEIDPKEAAAIRLIFENYVTGLHSYMTLADLLNDRGFRTREGKRFAKDTVADMIRNPFYAGKVVYKEGKRGDVGEIFDGQHQAIISLELWERCRQVRRGRRNVSKRSSARERPYLIGKIVRCHICGRILRAQTSGAGPYYRELSYERGYDDCPHSQRSTNAEALHVQLATILRQIRIPDDWQEEIAKAVGDSEEVRAQKAKRKRLEAERRRLKEAYVRGDFEEDMDIYRRELERIRRELDAMPGDTGLQQIKQAAAVLTRLQDIWGDANDYERRQLVQLMLKEVQADVRNDRLVWIKPQSPFIPLFRRVTFLREQELGRFAPSWTPEIAGILPYPTLPPLQSLPDTPLSPFLPVWPWPVPERARITRPLSTVLKERRKLGYTSGRCIEVPYEGVPWQRLDGRKWPHLTLERLSLDELCALPPGEVAFVTTPFWLQNPKAEDAMVERIVAVLAEQGCWHTVEVAPSAMPGHWLFHAFPALWELVQRHYASSYQQYNRLKKLGVEVIMAERAYYQALTYETAVALVRKRPGLLAALPDEVYEAGVGRLERALRFLGYDAQMGSTVVLRDVQVIRGIKWPRRKEEGRKYWAKQRKNGGK